MSNSNDTRRPERAPNLGELHEELSVNERRRGELRKELTAKREDVRRLEHRLSLLSGPLGESKRWRWYHWALLMMVLLGGWIGYSTLRTKLKQSALETRLSKQKLKISAHPRLLVTSQPEGAVVHINGEKAGKTPLLRPFQGKTTLRLDVEVALRGHKPYRKAVTIRRHGGAHVHAELEACGKDEQSATCTTGRRRSPKTKRAQPRPKPAPTVGIIRALLDKPAKPAKPAK